MTDRDVLKRAAEALRETGEPSAAELAKLRQRVLTGKVSASGRPIKARSVRWILPLAAAFIAASAFAATPGAWEGTLSAVERFLDVQLLAPSARSAQKPAKKPPSTVRPARPPEPESVPSAEPSAIAPAEQASADTTQKGPEGQQPAVVHEASQPVSDARPIVRPRPPKPEPEAKAAEPSVPAPEPRGPSRDLALYNAAHELHFRARRYDEALRAWETYLALSPAPTFALEARYNRAVCLVRLGHYEEARAALTPFAEGRLLGGYRREEAARFIQVLDKRR